jgi:hypothetical protein
MPIRRHGTLLVRSRCDRMASEAIPVLTSEQLEILKSQMEQSEAMHHKIMAKMADPKFDLLNAWERKEQLDLGIGRLIRDSAQK